MDEILTKVPVTRKEVDDLIAFRRDNEQRIAKLRDSRAGLGRYVGVVGPKLKDVLQKLADEPVDARLDLSGEIDVARAMVQQSLKYLEVIEHAGKDAETTVSLQAGTREAAYRMVRTNLTHVGQLCEKQARIIALTKNRVPLSKLRTFARRVAEVIELETRSPGPQSVDRLASAIENIRIEELSDVGEPDEAYDAKVVLSLEG